MYQNEGFCIKNDEFCIKNDEFWQGVAKQLAMARQKLAPLYTSLNGPHQRNHGSNHRGGRVPLEWGIDDSTPAVSSLWASIERDCGRIVRGFISEMLLWSSAPAVADVTTELPAAPWAWRWEEELVYREEPSCDHPPYEGLVGRLGEVKLWKLAPRLRQAHEGGKDVGVQGMGAAEATLLEAAERRNETAAELRRTEAGDLLELRMALREAEKPGIGQEGARIVRALLVLLGDSAPVEIHSVQMPRLVGRLLSCDLTWPADVLAAAEAHLEDVSLHDITRRADAMRGSGAALALRALGEWTFAAVASGKAVLASEARAKLCASVGDHGWPVVYTEGGSRLCMVDREAAGGGGGERVVAPLGHDAVLCVESAASSL